MKSNKKTPVRFVPLTHCPHGYSERFGNCATCHKNPGQCDYGACELSGVVNVYHVFPAGPLAGKQCEAPRGMCMEHAQFTVQLSANCSLKSPDGAEV